MKKSQTDLKEKAVIRLREPFELMLWAGILGISLMFLVFTMVFVLRKETGMADFKLPRVFWLSSLVIALSSFSIDQAGQAFKKESFRSYRFYLLLTLVLGGLFVLLQFLGWSKMIQQGISFKNSFVGSFIYLISGIHILHLAGGVLCLLLIFMDSLKNLSYVDSFVYSVNPPNRLRLRLVSIYWHFVDGLWIYLFLFFLYWQT
ncbi:MAG: cytochrome c oxidase subunit 3 [Microscillaceae bacterium]|nr:cytochrome c oxidase subunit 3 [Microscillaceae bacterium]